MNIYNFVTIKKAPPDPAKHPLLVRSRPTRSDDVLCADDVARDRIRDHVRRFGDPDMKKKILLIGGPSGVGKSLLATLILEEAGYSVLVATQTMTRREIADLLADASKSTTAVLFDDLDALMETVPGVAQDLVQHVYPLKGKRRATKKEKEACAANHWTAPVIATCKHPEYGKIADVAKQCEVVILDKPSRSAMIAYLARIARAENVPSEIDLGKIVDASRRDVRQALIALERRGRGVFSKDEDVDAIGAVTTMMMRNRAPASVATSMRMAQMDAGVIPSMIFENYLDVAALHGADAPEIVAGAASDMSIGDVLENAMYATGRFDMYDAYLAHAAVAPAMTVRTQSSHGVRFGNMWSKTSNMYVKKGVMKRIRDAVPGMWNVSDVVDRYAYASVLRDAYLKRLKGPIADLAAVCADPETLVDVCRFGLGSRAPSLVALQTVQKRLIKEKNMCRTTKER
jgi:hypothetical protein